LGNIEDIIDSAILLDTRSPKIDNNKETTSFMHHLYSVVRDTDTSEHLIDLLVEEVYNEHIDGTFRRAFQLKEMKESRLPGANPVYRNKDGLSWDAHPGKLNVDNVSDLFTLVKQYDKDFHPTLNVKVNSSFWILEWNLVLQE